eukprot:1138184-Pelagomonas_calceolata.AAC.1
MGTCKLLGADSKLWQLVVVGLAKSRPPERGCNQLGWKAADDLLCQLMGPNRVPSGASCSMGTMVMRRTSATSKITPPKVKKAVFISGCVKVRVMFLPWAKMQENSGIFRASD